MSEELNEQPIEELPQDGQFEEEGISAEELMKEHLSEIDAAYSEDGYFTRLKKMFVGLRMPRNSPEYKLARTEVNRLIAPLLAIVCPVMFIIVLCVMTEITGRAKEAIQVDIAQAQEDEALEEEGEQQEIEQTERRTLRLRLTCPPTCRRRSRKSLRLRFRLRRPIRR